MDFKNINITSESFYSYLFCKYKGYLKLKGKKGITTDFEKFNDSELIERKKKYFGHLSAKFKVKQLPDDAPLDVKTMKYGFDYLLNVSIIENDLFSKVHALEKHHGKSSLGDFFYIPVLVIPACKISKIDRLLLSYQSLLIRSIQSKQPSFGKIVFGRSHKTRIVRLDNLLKEIEQIISELNKVSNDENKPRLSLNKHCQLCEFKESCFQKAQNDDDLSLISGLKEKEISQYNNKGIFTVKQLSYTFRPRRKHKRSTKIIKRHYHALKALAIREKKVYILEKPELPTDAVKIYVDVEGDPERDFYYLIGLVIDTGRSIEKFSYWVDDKSKMKKMISKFLDRISRYHRIKVYHFGSYETRFFNSLMKLSPKSAHGTVKRIIDNSVNVLSIIYTSLYFPTYTNGLKEIAGYLGFNWTNTGASGLQSILLRRKWEKGRNPELKDNLIVYNAEDCLALKMLTEFILLLNLEREKPTH